MRCIEQPLQSRHDRSRWPFRTYSDAVALDLPVDERLGFALARPRTVIQPRTGHVKRNATKDIVIGGSLLAGVCAWLLIALGPMALVWLGVTVALTWLVLDLWFSGSEWRRVLAVVLMPALLLVYLMPSRYKRAIAQWRREGRLPEAVE